MSGYGGREESTHQFQKEQIGSRSGHLLGHGKLVTTERMLPIARALIW
jgi:hypothetical protein